MIIISVPQMTSPAFYRDWTTPLYKISAGGEAIIATPLILAVSLGGEPRWQQAGSATPAEVLATLIALLVPGVITAITNVSWSYQTAGGAATRVWSNYWRHPRCHRLRTVR